MTMISAIMGLGAAAMLLTGGYLFGARKGFQAREFLRRQNLQQAQELTRLQEARSQQESGRDDSLRTTIQQVLTPLIRREQLSLGLSRLKSSSGQSRDLSLLLDQIAEMGEFSTVLLSSEQGLPLAANGSAQELDRLLATASLLLLVADRIVGQHAPAPLSIMIHDETNSTTLCRIFRTRDQRLCLTAVASGARLTPTLLDPALVKVDAVLSTPS